MTNFFSCVSFRIWSPPSLQGQEQITGKELRSYIRHLDGIYIVPCLDVNAPTGSLSNERSVIDLRDDQSLPVVV
jgi:hypothetical protein